MSDQSWGNHYTGEAVFLGEKRDVLISGQLGPEPAAHGVLLFAERIDGQADLPPYLAEITLRAGVTSTSFLCDFRGQFSAIFERIEVRLLSYNPSVLSEEFWIAPTGRFKHGAFVGFGGWHAASSLTYTAQQLNPTTPTQVIQVPTFARRLFLRPCVHTGASYDLTGVVVATDPSEANLSSVSFCVGSGNGSNAIPFYRDRLTRDIIEKGIDVAGASSVVLSSNGVSPLIQPVFELQL